MTCYSARRWPLCASISNLTAGRGAVVCPSGGDDTAIIQAACEAVASSSVHGVVYLTEGEFYVSSISLPWMVSLIGCGVGITRLKRLAACNTDAIVETAGFAALDAAANYGTQGGGVGGGTFRSSIARMTIDGNRAQNSSGGGVRLYGKGFFLHDLAIENANGDLLYTGFNGPDNFSSPDGTLEADVRNVILQQNDGAGWVFRGPHDCRASSVVALRCATVGWDVQRSVHAERVNTYLCQDGIHTHDGGVIYGSTIVGCGTRYGGLFETSGSCITGSSWNGDEAGLEVRTDATMISGMIANCESAALRLNGDIAGGRFDIVIAGGNHGPWIDNGPTSPNVVSHIDLTSWQSTGGTLFNDARANPIPIGITRVVAPAGKTGTYTR